MYRTLETAFSNVEPFVERANYHSFICSDEEGSRLLIRTFVDDESQPEREKDIASRLQASVVPNFFQCKEIELPHLASNYEGEITLREHLVSNGVISVNKAITFAIQLLLFLEECHREEIIFRGISPDTILLNQFGKIKIIDFEEAFLIGEDHRYAAPSFPKEGIEYLAPEYLERYQLDFRSDIYQLGLLLFEMTSGQLPWRYRSIAKLLQEKSQAVIHLHRIDPSIPIPFSLFISRMMEPSPKRRFSSALQVRLSLEESIKSDLGATL